MPLLIMLSTHVGAHVSGDSSSTLFISKQIKTFNLATSCPCRCSCRVDSIHKFRLLKKCDGATLAETLDMDLLHTVKVVFVWQMSSNVGLSVYICVIIINSYLASHHTPKNRILYTGATCEKACKGQSQFRISFQITRGWCWTADK